MIGLHTAVDEGHTRRMDVVASVVFVLGPVAVFLLLLLKAIRKLQPRRAVELPPWQPQTGEPPSGRGLAGDREPRRPLAPTHSGAIALALPAEDEETDDPTPLRRTGPPSSASHDRQRRAG